MATALSMVTRAMRLARVIGKGEVADDDEAQDGLEALNTMLDSWQTERLFVYQIQQDSFTWTTSTTSRTVGLLGDFAMAAPARIDDSSFFRVNNVDYSLVFLNSDQYAAIPAKSSASSIPEYMYVEYGTALHTLYAFPVLSAAVTFLLRSWQALQSFSALTTALDLPMGYQRAIEFSLAEEIAAEYGRDVSPKVERIAAHARKNIKRINLPMDTLTSEIGMMTRRSGFNIYAG